MFLNFKNILNVSELLELTEMCKQITYDETPNKIIGNAYYRKYITINDDLKKKIFKIINEEIHIEYDLMGSWINVVSPNSNLNDDFHVDASDLTFVFYLNDNFEGGYFEYIEKNTNKIYQIKPTTNQLLIMNDTLKHRVTNVTIGNRYSLIVFLKYKPKIKKSLL